MGLGRLTAHEGVYDGRQPPDAQEEEDRDRREADGPVGEELGGKDDEPPP